MQENKPVFENRADATTKILDILPRVKIIEKSSLIVCISTQAIPIANMIATRLSLNYDLLFSEPICAPNNKDCIIGMVSETQEIVLHRELVDSFEISLDFIYAEAHRRYEESILPKVYKYRKGDLISSLDQKNILLVDDGSETGMTIMSAIKTVMKSGARSVVYATPILSIDVARLLEPVTDEIFFVHKVLNFIDIEFYYKAEKELSTDEVLQIISNSKYYLPFQKAGNKEDFSQKRR